MVNSKRHKLVCCLMAMVLLLSFFYVVPDPAGKAERGNAAACVADGQAALTGEMRHEGSWQNMMSAQTLLEARDAKPDACTDTFTMIRSVLDEVVMREQAGMRSLLSKLLAVVVWVMLLVCVVCRILSRRYGCRMIYHWENIYYIHQTDGKKGDCLLNYLHI